MMDEFNMANLKFMYYLIYERKNFMILIYQNNFKFKYKRKKNKNK